MLDKYNIDSLMQENPLMALQKIMKILRDPQVGCAWDKQQTHESIASSLIEETYEVYQALLDFNTQDKNSIENLKEELGDLLLQIVFHAQMAKEKKLFDINDVAREVSRKLIRRHPHIFENSNNTKNSSNEILKNWEQIKRQEKEQKQNANKNIFESMLTSLPKSLPSLHKAQRMGQKVGRVNFSLLSDSDDENFLALQKKYNDLKIILEKVDLKENFSSAHQKEQAEKELGNFLFYLAHLVQQYNIDAEKALYKANEDFQLHFAFVEEQLQEQLLQNKLPTKLQWQELWQK